MKIERVKETRNEVNSGKNINIDIKYRYVNKSVSYCT